MKTFKYISLLAGISLVGSVALSCVSDNDFLTEKPKDKLTVSNAYNTGEQILSTVLTGYYEMEELYFPGFIGGMSYDLSSGTDMSDHKYVDMDSHTSNFAATWSTTSSMPKSFWDKFYKIISYSNLAFSKMDEVQWSDETQKSRVVGEARFLRGLSYLRLAELFGGVPLVLEYSETPNYAYERASRTETYKVAIEDLKAAYDALPWNVSAEYGRAGKGAAAMYLAEALLADGVETGNDSEFTQAATYAREVVEHHPLMRERFGVRLPGATGSNYGIPNEDPDGNVMSDLFVAQNIVSPANTEAIWLMVSVPSEADYNLYGGVGRRNCTLNLTPTLQDYVWAKEYVEEGAGTGPWQAFSDKYGGATSPAFLGGTGWAIYTPTWYASFTMWDAEHNNNSAEDLRYVEDVTVMTEFLCCDDKHSLYEKKLGWDYIDRSSPGEGDRFFPIFYKETPFDEWDYDPSTPPGWFGAFANFYRSRYAARSSEAYLLLSEALLRSGDTAGATAALNEVRTRAHATPFGTVTIDTILDERARELLYEEFRWATFLRMKPEEWKPRIYNYGKYCARPGTPVYPEIRRWAEDTGEIAFNLWPIPQTYIDLNTGSDGLTQNPGWK